jgi:hypothetical protein
MPSGFSPLLHIPQRNPVSPRTGAMLYRQRGYVRNTLEVRGQFAEAIQILERVLGSIGTVKHTLECRVLGAIESCYIQLKEVARKSEVPIQTIKLAHEIVKGVVK